MARFGKTFWQRALSGKKSPKNLPEGLFEKQ
jgi:hypothetical protein